MLLIGLAENEMKKGKKIAWSLVVKNRNGGDGSERIGA